jgi:thiol-disulfide isomerase/thioredoxin
MKRLPRLVFGLLLAANPFLTSRLSAQGSPEAPSGRIHALKITVRDAVTKQPITGTEVMVFGAPDVPKGITDAEGIATLRVPLDVPFAERMERFEMAVTDPRYATRRMTWITTAGRVREALPESYNFQLSRGVTAGGVVRDANGNPVVGAKVIMYGTDYKGFTRRRGTETKTSQEFSAVSTDELNPIFTDEKGEWRKEHFPEDLTQVSIEVIRPGGSLSRFTSDASSRPGAGDRSTAIDIATVKAGSCVFTLKDGVTLQGRVVDESGKPISGAQLRARDANSRNRPYTFATDLNGTFELLNWDATSVLITAESKGHQTKSVRLPLGKDTPLATITLAPAKPLKLRLVGDNDVPLANAELQTNPNPSDQILNWKGVTDAEGRIEWETAPDAPVELWMNAKDYPHRSQKLLADGTEHVIRFRKGADKSIHVRLRVVDAETGAPIPAFEVWRRLPSTPFKPWGEPAEKGEFKTEFASSDLPNGFVPSYRLQVRASGYTGWGSETLDFSNGDQDLTIKLTKGEFSLPDEAPPRRQPGLGMTVETHPGLVVLAGHVSRLLETGDIPTFVKAMTVSAEDWASLVPKSLDAKEAAGTSREATIRRQEKALTASATHVLEKAREAGLVPGKMKFVLKSVSSPDNSSTHYRFGNESVPVPSATAIRIIFAGEPVGDNGGKPLQGDYELSVGNAQQMPAGWRAEEGLRWVNFPAGVANEATRRELRLANRIVPAGFGDQRTLSGTDDQALLAFGTIVADLFRQKEIPVFLKATTFTRPEIIGFFQRGDLGDEQRASEVDDKVSSGVSGAAQAMIDLQNRLGVDLSDAKITVKQVLAERPAFTRFGEIEGIRAGPLRVTFAVESSRVAKSGAPVSGNYIVSIGNAVRSNNRWVLLDDKLRWQEFPKGVLTTEDLKTIELENYVAENRSLPPGFSVPEFEMIRLADSSRVPLSAYRGKIIVLELWASWCGPCQEPMEKLQDLRDMHPEWKDRVEIIALSIDDKANQATDHLAKKQWSKTVNLWAGDGGFSSVPSRALRIRGVPTAYVIDGDGKVITAGHPASMDFGAIVAAQLRKAASGNQ